jgi:hypothetical protein
VRKQQEIGLVFECLIHGAHIVVHARADTFAGGEKIMYGRHFTLQFPFGKGVAFLRGKRKRLERANGRHFPFGKARDYPRHYQEKNDNQHTEKSKIKNIFA